MLSPATPTVGSLRTLVSRLPPLALRTLASLACPEYYMEMGLSLDFTYWNSRGDLILFPSNEETH